MKKIILLSILFISFVAVKSQTTSISYAFCISPPITVNSDSVTLSAQLVAGDGYKSISWIQASGPSIAVFGTPVNTFQNTTIQKQLLPVRKMIPGIYSFTAIGSTVGGISYPLTTTVTVVAPPKPRSVVSVSFVIVNGVWTAVYKYDDGSTQ